jgi:tripartite-type tricarboxylate transporter receptor subunit TctC
MSFVAKSLKVLILACVVVAAAGNARAADEVADFFKGKTVTIAVGFPPGGGYDIYARVLSKYLPKYIPGNPAVIVKNQAGAGSLAMVNDLYTRGPKDGTVIGAPSNSIAFAPLQGEKAATFDPTKFNWIGSPNKETGVLIAWHTVPVDTIQDVMKKEISVGVSVGSSSSFARILNAALGLKLKLIVGYDGTPQSFLAMERGEVDAYPSAFWTSLKSAKPDWIEKKQVKMLVQFGAEPNPDPLLKGVPFARDVAQGENAKLLLDVAVAVLAFGRPYMLPPETPPARVAAIRKAFLDTYKDADFLKQAEKEQLEVDPVTGEQMHTLLERTYGAPQDVVERLREIYVLSNQK